MSADIAVSGPGFPHGRTSSLAAMATRTPAATSVDIFLWCTWKVLCVYVTITNTMAQLRDLFVTAIAELTGWRSKIVDSDEMCWVSGDAQMEGPWRNSQMWTVNDIFVTFYSLALYEMTWR
jgi:hypothetical protein